MDSKFKINKPFFDKNTDVYFFVRRMSRYQMSKQPLLTLKFRMWLKVLMLSAAKRKEWFGEDDKAIVVKEADNEDINNQEDKLL